MNSPIQGTAADMLKLAMIKVARVLKEGDFKTKMLLTVHDELVFDLYRAEQEQVVPLIEEAMKTALRRVPEIDRHACRAWVETHATQAVFAHRVETWIREGLDL